MRQGWVRVWKGGRRVGKCVCMARDVTLRGKWQKTPHKFRANWMSRSRREEREEREGSRRRGGDVMQFPVYYSYTCNPLERTLYVGRVREGVSNLNSSATKFCLVAEFREIKLIQRVYMSKVWTFRKGRDAEFKFCLRVQNLVHFPKRKGGQ